MYFPKADGAGQYDFPSSTWRIKQYAVYELYTNVFIMTSSTKSDIVQLYVVCYFVQF